MGCCGSSGSTKAGTAYEVSETLSAATVPTESDGTCPMHSSGDGGAGASTTTNKSSSSGSGRPQLQPSKTKTLEAIAAGHASKGGADILALEDEDGSGGCGTILKLLDETEFEVYTRLTEEFRDDPILRFIPRFQGALSSQDESGNEAQFIRITNLLHGFHQPKVMDVKIGVRTFLESECKNKKLRPDLYEKMAKMYPTEITDAERTEQSITKHRWMTVRDKVTTIGTMGYRIDGIAGHKYRPRKDVDQELAKVENLDDAAACFKDFAEVVATNEKDPNLDNGHTAVFVAERIRQLLAEMRAALEKSDFVRRHEFIGSSILIVADAFGHYNVAWIDFAKTSRVEDGVHVTHNEPWIMGNHEDGILIGFNSLIEGWDTAVGNLRMEDHLGLSSTAVSGFESCRPRPSLRFAEDAIGAMDSIAEDSSRRGSLQSSTTKDLVLLSSLPVFSGVVADARGKLWQAGQKARMFRASQRPDEAPAHTPPQTSVTGVDTGQEDAPHEDVECIASM